MSAIDLTPLLQTGVELVAIAGGVVGTWALTRLGQRFGMQVTQGQAQMFDAAIEKSIQAGGVLAEQAAAAKGWNHPDVKSQVLDFALEYAASRFPGALKAQGLDPTNSGDMAKVRAALSRALPAAITPVAASPATTNGPAAPAVSIVVDPAQPATAA